MRYNLENILTALFHMVAFDDQCQLWSLRIVVHKNLNRTGPSQEREPSMLDGATVIWSFRAESKQENIKYTLIKHFAAAFVSSRGMFLDVLLNTRKD